MTYIHKFDECPRDSNYIDLRSKGGSCESLPSKGGALTCSSDSGLLELSDSGGGGGPHGEWDSVPAVVQQCIKHLEANGLHTLGVFRVSPSKKRVRQVLAPSPFYLLIPSSESI